MEKDVESILLHMLKNGTKTFHRSQFGGEHKRFMWAVDFLQDLASDNKLDIVEQRRDDSQRIDAIVVSISERDREALEEE